MTPKGINYLILAGFTVLAAIGITHHELWSDEVHHWLLARDSGTPVELYHNLRYDGHPMFWNLLLFAISRFTPDPSFMQWLNLVISFAAMATFIFNAPFTNLQKLLFVLGYFPLFEYTLISRSYSLILLFFFVALAIYAKHWSQKPILLGTILFLLANTHLLGLILAGSFLLVISYDCWVTKVEITSKIGGGLLISIMGMTLSLCQIIPPADSSLMKGWLSQVSIYRVAGPFLMFAKGFIPLPDFFHYHFWNHFLILTIYRPLLILLSLSMILFPFFQFKSHSQSFILFYSAALGMGLFFFFATLSGTRYFGILFMAYVGALWIITQNNSGMFVRIKTINFILTMLLFIQAAGGVIAWTLDLQRPFSESKYAAQYIRQNNLQDNPILIENCLRTPTVTYLEKKAFFLTDNRWGSFCVWNSLLKANTNPSNDQFLISRALEFVNTTKQNALLLHNRPLDIGQGSQIKLIKVFDRNIVETEGIYLYMVRL